MKTNEEVLLRLNEIDPATLNDTITKVKTDFKKEWD
jgi:hypothetical protein